MRFRPCIDLRHGQVTQIVGSTLTATTAAHATASAASDSAVENFVSKHPSSHYSLLYRDAGLSGGHVIMLGAGNERAAREALQAWPGGLQLGGGIDDSNAQQWLDAGASHVIVTSWLFSGGGVELDMARLERLERLVGRGRLVLDLSCRRRADDPSGAYFVVTNRWQTFSSLRVDGATLRALSRHCSEFLIHGVDVEGKRAGIEEPLIRTLRQAMDEPGGEQLRIVYAGGVRDMSDVQRVDELGGGRIDGGVGSALSIFGGNLPFEQIVEYCNRREKGASIT